MLKLGFALAVVSACVACSRNPVTDDRREAAINHIKALRALAPHRRRTPGPLQPDLTAVKPSPKGIFTVRFESTWNGRYLNFFDPLEPEAATIHLHFPNRDHNIAAYWATYPDGKEVRFGSFGNIEEREKWQKEELRLQGKTERKSLMVNGKEQVVDMPMQPRVSKDLDVDVSIPSGYGSALRKGKLIVSDGQEEVRLPLNQLPAPKPTNVDQLPVADTYHVDGKAIKVELRRGMLGVDLAPDPKEDPAGYKQAHQEATYSAAFFNAKAPADLASDRTLELVMRLKRTKWSDHPGPWFVLKLRDVLNPHFEPVTEYSFSADPNSKQAEFEAILVETRAWTETARIPDAGSIDDRTQIVAPNDLVANFSSGYRVQFGKGPSLEIDDVKTGSLQWETTVSGPKASPLSDYDSPNPLKNADFVTDVQFTGQSTERNHDFGEPLYGIRGRWHEGPLGDAVVTICHLERHVGPTQTLRLPLLTGGKESDEMYMGGNTAR